MFSAVIPIEIFPPLELFTYSLDVLVILITLQVILLVMVISF